MRAVRELIAAVPGAQFGRRTQRATARRSPACGNLSAHKRTFPAVPVEGERQGCLPGAHARVTLRRRSGYIQSVTVDALAVGTARPNLDLAIDLGDTPALLDVAEHMDALVGVWAYCLERSRRAERGRHTSIVRPPPPQTRAEVEADVARQLAVRNGPRLLAVKRMSLASPWEALLTVAAGKSAPVLYLGAAVVALERLMRMLMEWQQHRMDMAERKGALSIDRPELMELRALLERHAARGRDEAGEPSDSAVPPRTVEPSDPIVTLARRRIVRAQLIPDEE
jgi:hypothetical protein